MKELGYKDLTYVAFKWISIPKETQNEVAEYLKTEVNKAIMSDEYRKFIKELNGLDVKIKSEETLTSDLKKYRDKFGKILDSIGVKKVK